jgi:hypothetical protein
MRNVFIKKESSPFLYRYNSSPQETEDTICIYVPYTELCLRGKFSLTPCPTALQFG